MIAMSPFFDFGSSSTARRELLHEPQTTSSAFTTARHFGQKRAPQASQWSSWMLGSAAPHPGHFGRPLFVERGPTPGIGCGVGDGCIPGGSGGIDAGPVTTLISVGLSGPLRIRCSSVRSARTCFSSSEPSSASIVAIPGGLPFVCLNSSRCWLRISSTMSFPAIPCFRTRSASSFSPSRNSCSLAARRICCTLSSSSQPPS